MVKTTVEGLIKLLRCHINARQSTESEPEDIKITRPFIEKLILALLHCCQFNLVNSSVAFHFLFMLVLKDNNQYHECLTAVSGSAGCGDEVVLFDDDEELANSVSRISITI